MAKTVRHRELKSYFGEEDHLTVSQNNKFSDLIFELLSEQKPTSKQSQIFELILNLSIDHGPDTPSAVETIKAAKEGKTISEAVAAGVLQINNVHGGAIEPAMELFYRIKNYELRIKNVIEEYIKEDKKIAGYGHRMYKDSDFRAQLILQKLQEMGLGEEYIGVAKELEVEIEKQKGKRLPLNIDGAIAIALCSFGWSLKLGKAVFLIARTPGLCGHFLNNS